MTNPNRHLAILTSFLVFFAACNAQNRDQARPSFTINNGDTVKLSYSANGKVREAATMKNGSMYGQFTTYFFNGNIQQQGHMNVGRRTGVWKLFGEDGKLKNVNVYHNDKLLHNLDIQDFTFRQYKADKDTLSINLPASWTISNKKDWELIMCRRPGEVNERRPYISVVKDTSREAASFEKYCSRRKEAIGMMYPPGKLVAERRFRIGNRDCYQVAFSYREGNSELGCVQTWIKMGNAIYSVAGVAGNDPAGDFLKFKGLFEEITASIRIK